MQATFPKMDIAGGSEPCGKVSCKMCHNIITTSTFATKACGEVFEIQSGPQSCNSEKQ